MLRAEPLGNMPRHQPVGGLVGQGGDAGLEQGDVGMAALTGGQAANQSHQQRLFQLMRRQKVDQRHRHLDRLPSGLAVHIGEAASGLQDGIISGAGIIRPVAADLPVDELRIDFCQGGIIQAQLAVVTRLVTGDGDIGPAHQIKHHHPTFWHSQIQGNGALAPVDGSKVSGDVVSRRFPGQLPAAGNIASPGGIFYFDHRGAQLGEKHAHRGTGKHAGQFQNEEVGEYGSVLR